MPVIPVARVPSTPLVDGPHALELPDGRLVVYQPHAHVLATTRPLVDGALGPKDRDLSRKAFLIGSRKLWEHLCNQTLAETGATHRVNQRSKWHRHRQQQDLGAAGPIPEPLSQVPLGPAYHPVVEGRALDFGGVGVMPHEFNAIVAELEKSRRAAPDKKSVRLARAVVRIEELEAQGVRFSRETGGMVRVEAPSGVVVDWHDRALWSGIHAMVLDYLETRDAERKVRAPEPGTVGITVPEASDRMSTAPEPTMEAAWLGLWGVTRGKAVRTTSSDQAAPCPLDRVNRQFQAPRPNALWVADFTYVATWQGFVYVAFVIDTFARRIVGWRVSRTAHTGFVLDALEQALHDRRPAKGSGLIHHSDRGSQYVAIKYTERLTDAGVEPSVGSVGDSYDNALRERDFGTLHHRGGVSPPWPISYADLAPYYLRAERLYSVHGQRGSDPTEPPCADPYPYPPVSHEPRIQELSDDLMRAGHRPFPLPVGIRLDEAGCSSSVATRPADSMKRPSPIASMRYSGQCARRVSGIAQPPDSKPG
ncbi:transposase InsO family protein [Azospirillum melinis]|nr:transposase InsO family protein [Azospirillum melinis]